MVTMPITVTEREAVSRGRAQMASSELSLAQLALLHPFLVPVIINIPSLWGSNLDLLAQRTCAGPRFLRSIFCFTSMLFCQACPKWNESPLCISIYFPQDTVPCGTFTNYSHSWAASWRYWHKWQTRGAAGDAAGAGTLINTYNTHEHTPTPMRLHFLTNPRSGLKEGEGRVVHRPRILLMGFSCQILGERINQPPFNLWSFIRLRRCINSLCIPFVITGSFVSCKTSNQSGYEHGQDGGGIAVTIYLQ